MTPAYENLLSPAEAAKILGTTPGTLGVWRCTKRWPLRYVKIGASVRYRLADVEAFIKSGIVEPTAAAE
jgi:hypothetical protein